MPQTQAARSQTGTFRLNRPERDLLRRRNQALTET